MNVRMVLRHGHEAVLLTLFLTAILVGCSDEDPLSSLAGSPRTGEELDAATEAITSPPPPAGVVTVPFDGHELTWWPYTGMDFSGDPMDPGDLIFVGQADPLRIRAALLALDGDRSAFGFPNTYPFNATWSDAHGDVQVTYAGDNGWTGSAVQLQLGSYEPVRWHLRLFQTGDAFGSGVWTVGAAHFELMIPGTADHQVLSWEVAEQMVMIDMIRTGLLDPALPYAQTEILNAQPSFREIPAVIYNALPQGLIDYIGGPPQPVSVPVPILTDGRATILNVAQAQPVLAGTTTQDFVLTYEMVIPKPICNPSGSEFVLITGPVTFHKSCEVTASGNFVFDGYYQGDLMITPWDLGTGQPSGPSYPAEVLGQQNGQIHSNRTWVKAHDERLAHQIEGTELLMTWLAASNPGQKTYRIRSHCF